MTLRNKLGIQEFQKFQTAEAELTNQQMTLLADSPVKGSFDFLHLKAIHKFIFNEIYEWAGEPRTVTTYRGTTAFCAHDKIEERADEIFAGLKNDNYLCGLPKGRFIDKIADYMADINTLHAFCDGNGRVQRLFYKQLAENAGYELNFGKVIRSDILLADKNAANGDKTGLKAVLNVIVEPLPHSKEVKHDKVALYEKIKSLFTQNPIRSRFSSECDATLNITIGTDNQSQIQSSQCEYE
jgi:cell filamentation protein